MLTKEPSFEIKSNSVPGARKNSKDMQNLLVAIKEFSMDEIKAIRNSDVYNFRAYVYGIRAYGKNDPKCIVCMASQKDLDYAISIAPKTFKVKQG